ncbi:MAG TPA: phage tail sheath C-terminal domain-containing protein [Longimicrobium sp.]|nr:phage tail sheath C-terminal domain-containing protein [Longimicrobium sp.]
MPEYLSPGVYVEEIEVGTKPIEGVSTSNLGIVGPTERGPTDVRLVTSALEFQRLYGNPIAGWHLAHAVKGFFDNGGRRCFMARVTAAAATASGADLGTLRLEALGPGAWGDNVLFMVGDPSQRDPANAQNPNPNRFRLVLAYYTTMPDTWPADFVDPTQPGAQSDRNFRRPDVLEVFDNLSHEAGDANYVLRVLGGSNLVFGNWEANQVPARPANAAFARLQGGGGGAPGLADFQGADQGPAARNGAEMSWSTGLLGLSRVDEVNILAAPDEHRVNGVRGEIINQCETLRDRFALFSVAQGSRTVNDIQPDPPTSFAALYWPWIQVMHPNGLERVTIPPVGHVAGILARTDVERGVHKAPANAVVRGALDLEFPVSRGMQDILNPRGVNVIRDFRADGNGIRLWGARTMSSDPAWKYINVRRLFLFMEESIDEGTQWVVFEPNSEPLWDRVERSIESFLLTVWRNGALMGRRPEEAFYVKCDRTTMTQDDIDNGRLICYIGVAPVKPAEFVIFRIHQWTLESGMAV